MHKGIEGWVSAVEEHKETDQRLGEWSSRRIVLCLD